MSARLEQVIFSYLDIEAVTDEIVVALEDRDLPPTAATTLRALAGPLEAGVRNFVGDRIEDVVESPAFATAWTEANRTAHEQLVAALLGETGRGRRDRPRLGQRGPRGADQHREAAARPTPASRSRTGSPR